MYILEIIPLAAMPPQVPQLLSYFFNEDLPKGALVQIAVGNRKVPAVVASSTPLEQQRISLKKSAFQLKKISGVISDTPIITDVQFKIALWLSRNYFSSLSTSFKTILPSFFLNPKYPFAYPKLNPSELAPPKPIFFKVPSKKNLDKINEEVKKILKQKKQALIVVPELSLIEHFYEYFARYSETAVIHGKVSPKQLYKNWQQIASGDTEIVVGTRQALFAPFSNLGLIVVEDLFHEAYKSDMSPKYNTPDLARKVAEAYQSQLIFTASIPDAVTHYKTRNNDYELRNISSSHNPEIRIIDMVQEIKSGNFSVYGRDLKKLIREYIDKEKKVLLFSSRKGYSGIFVCDNCGFMTDCQQCSIPMRYHKVPEGMLICHHCNEFKKAPAFCSNCNSYKVKSAGIPGSQKLTEELERIFIDADSNHKPQIITLDSGTAKNAKTEKEIMEKIKDSNGFILIATQMALSHRYSHNFDLIGIPQADALTNIPDYQAEERLLYQFEKLRDFNPEKIIIQTYHAENAVYSILASRDYHDFYENELAARSMLWYPPYARLVKLSFKGFNKEKASYEATVLSGKFKMLLAQKNLNEKVKLLGPSPAFIEKEKNYYVYNIILKILPSEKMENILKYVPSNWSINVDPRSIL